MIIQFIKSRIKGYSLIIGTAYFGLLMILIFFQNSFLFVPNNRQFSPAQAGLASFETVIIPTSDNEQLVGWYKKPEKKDGKVILLFHGNGGNNLIYVPLIKDLEPLADGFLIVDYRGYGGSTGRPDSDGLLKDSDASLKYLQDQGIKSEQLIICGNSLGTGIAVHTAQKIQASAIILIAAYSSLADIVKSWFFFYPDWVLDTFLTNNIDAIENIEKIKTPLVIVHGMKDKTIPYELADKLYQAANEPKLLISLPDSDHIIPITDDIFSQIKGFLDTHSRDVDSSSL